MNDSNDIPSFSLFDDDEYPTGHGIPSTGPADFPDDGLGKASIWERIKKAGK